MSAFDDPQYMAESKAGLRSYILTGDAPPNFFRPHGAAVASPMRLSFAPQELRSLCAAMRQAGPRGRYTKLLPRDFPHSQTVILAKVYQEGGRQAFLDKYGDL